MTFILNYNKLTSQIKALNENLTLLDKDSIDKYDTKTRLNMTERLWTWEERQKNEM